jgi:hypothetical protein
VALGHVVKSDLKDRRELVDHKDLLVPRVIQERKGHKVFKARREFRERRV